MSATSINKNKIPGPRGIPLLKGKLNMPKFFLLWTTYLREMHDTYGDIVGLAEDDPSWVFVFSPTLNHDVLANPETFINDAGPFLRLPKGSTLEKMFLHTLGVMNGQHHKQQRRLMQPAFHRNQIEGYHQDMVALTDETFNRWRVGDTKDMLVEMKNLTQRIAVKSLFGGYQESEIERVTAFLHATKQIPFVMMAPYDIPGLPFYRVSRMAEKLQEYLLDKIAEKRTQVGATDVLATLVHAHDEDGATLSDEEMISHALALFVAGHETTSHALTLTLLLLHQHPEIHAALLDELTSVLHGDAPTAEQLKSLPLLDGVIKESLRLLPPAPIGIRLAAHECELGGHTVPKGATVFYSQLVTHRSPELYPHPDRFMPERWATIHPTIYEYLPFAAGPHMCIGAGFALQELKVVLAMMVQRYRLALTPNHKIDLSIGMQPSAGMPMAIHPQDRQFAKVQVRGNIKDLVEAI